MCDIYLKIYKNNKSHAFKIYKNKDPQTDTLNFSIYFLNISIINVLMIYFLPI